jgi:hypothetical protein
MANQFGSRRITDEEWSRLQRSVGPMSSRIRSAMDESILSRNKSARVAARDTVRSLSPKPSGIGWPGSVTPEKANPFFELQWDRAVQEVPELAINEERNRQIMWEAYYNHDSPRNVRDYYVQRWEELLGRSYSSRDSWIYEGQYDEMEERPEEYEEYDERPEI